MANIKSAIKRNKQNEKRRIRNRVYRGRARTFVAKARRNIAKAESEEITMASVAEAISALDRAALRGAGVAVRTVEDAARRIVTERRAA